MENFDFNEPISTEIIFEDTDDDDVNLSTFNLNSKLKVPADITVTINTNDETGPIKQKHLQNNESLELIENTPAAEKQKKSNKRALDMPFLDKPLNGHSENMYCNRDNTTFSNNENSVPNNNQPQNNYQQSNKKRNDQESLTKNSYDPSNTSKIECNPLNANINLHVNQNSNSSFSKNFNKASPSYCVVNEITNVNNTISNSQMSIDQTNTNKSSTARLNPDHSIVTNCNDVQTHAACNDYSNINTFSSGYLKKLLESVSENMIKILTEFTEYMNVYKNSTDCKYVKRARYNLARKKLHYFNLSYSSVLNIIIPKEYDLRFVKSFIDNTIILAQSKRYKYSYTQVETLYYEMMAWVKTRKQNDDRFKNLSTNVNNHPMLSNMLHNIPNNMNRPPPPYRPSAEVNNAKSTLHNISPIAPPFIHGLPDNMVNRTNFLNINSNNQNYEQQLNNSNAMQRTSFRNSLDTIHKSTFEGNIYPTIHNPNLYNQNVMDKSYGASTYCRGYNIPNQYQNKPLEHSSSIQSFSTNQLPMENERRQEPFQYYQRQENVQPDQLTSDQYRSEKQAHNKPTYNNQHSMESQRSSISRDSGFISPQNFDFMTNMQDEPNQDATPIITHVTSLNTNALHIIEGSCYVCGKSTRKMCQGCYNMYYCSQDCQYDDWNSHRAICTRKASDL